MRPARHLFLALLLCPALAAADVAPAVPLAAQTFPLDQVRLLDSPFKAAQEADHAYLLSIDPDRLLHYVRLDAGLAPKGDHYGGWEGGGAQMIGHYLSGCSLMYAATGDARLKQRVAYAVDQLAECQQAGRDGPGGFGGLYNFPSGRKSYFPALFRGEVPHVPVSDWYHEHKLMAGLRDAAALTGNDQARVAWLAMCDWCVNVMSHLSDDAWQQVLDQEHGGPHEVLADAYLATGDRKYLDAALHWCHRKVFDPLADGDDAVLDGLHANCQIPKFVGYERVSQMTGDGRWHAAAANFWSAVVGHRSWVIGGNSQWEHFFPAAEFPAKLNESCGPETCNTYNMLKLTRSLFQREPRASYIDYFERGLYNHILSSIDVANGGVAYYTSMEPGHYRVFSTPFDSFWCCVGTGMENHAQYGQMVFAHSADALLLNLLIPCELTWPQRGATVRLETRFPEQDAAKLRLTLAAPIALTLKVRCPAWVSPGAMAIRVNGEPTSIGPLSPDGYVPIHRTWHTGDTVDVRWPMRITTEPLPNDAGHVAVLDGPIVLAAAMGAGDVPPAKFHQGRRDMRQLAELLTPTSDVPTLVADTAADVAAAVRPVAGKPLTFTFGSTSKPAGATLVPFYTIAEQRYCIYWPVATPAGYAERQRRTDAQLALERAADARTVDHVVVGQRASEADHRLQSAGSTAGVAAAPFPFWRDAKGYVAYQLAVAPGSAMAVRCVYWGADAGRAFDVMVDGRTVGTEALSAARPGGFVVSTYPIPRDLLAGKRTVTVRFQPHEGSVAGGVFDVRTVRG